MKNLGTHVHKRIVQNTRVITLAAGVLMEEFKKASCKRHVLPCIGSSQPG